MSSSTFYRIAAVLLLIFAVGHTLGFRSIPPEWKADSVVAAMRSVHFDVGGFSRSYWDFFTGLGLFVAILQLLAAVVAWQLAGLGKETLRLLPLLRWSFATCFVGASVVSWMYVSVVPFIFSLLIAICLTLATWLV
jgi:hypothetical protein